MWQLPAAQRRLAGEPKASTDLHLSSRICTRSCTRSCLAYWWFDRRRKPTSHLARFPYRPCPPCPMYQSSIFRSSQDIWRSHPRWGLVKYPEKMLLSLKLLLFLPLWLVLISCQISTNQHFKKKKELRLHYFPVTLQRRKRILPYADYCFTRCALPGRNVMHS